LLAGSWHGQPALGRLRRRIQDVLHRRGLGERRHGAGALAAGLPEKVAQVAARRNIPFVMNISAPFLVFVEVFRVRVLALIEHADFVFCNHLEAAALGQAMGWGDDLLTIARSTAALPKKNGARARRVVFTHGGEPALLVGGDHTEPHYFAPIKLAEKELVDENGAGDAYVGGFLAAMAKGASIPECFASAAYCAWVVIRRVGCTLPEKHEPKEVDGHKFFFN